MKFFETQCNYLKELEQIRSFVRQSGNLTRSRNTILALPCKPHFFLIWPHWDIKISKCLYVSSTKMVGFSHFFVFKSLSERNHKTHLLLITLYLLCLSCLCSALPWCWCPACSALPLPWKWCSALSWHWLLPWWRCSALHHSLSWSQRFSATPCLGCGAVCLVCCSDLFCSALLLCLLPMVLCEGFAVPGCGASA